MIESNSISEAVRSEEWAGATVLHEDDLSSLWLGDCLNEAHVDAVMRRKKADLLCFDAPYSDRTHAGHDSQKNYSTSKDEPRDNRRRKEIGLKALRNIIDYSAWSQSDVATFCSVWLPRVSGWVVTMTDHVLARAWETELTAGGLYVFPPLPLVETGSRVRMAGDGPSNWTCWVIVARPRGEPWSSWGTLRGGYVVPAEHEARWRDGTSPRVVGGKPLLAMQCIVDDYSRRGALVVDPTMGGGTTLRAAKGLGRRCIGMEQDPGRAALAVKAVANVNIGQRALFEIGASK